MKYLLLLAIIFLCACDSNKDLDKRMDETNVKFLTYTIHFYEAYCSHNYELSQLYKDSAHMAAAEFKLLYKLRYNKKP